MAKLIELGSGSAVLRKRRKSSCHLVEIANKLIMLDCGWGVTNIVQTSYDLQKIDHILISHPHVDHLGNLINTLQSIYVSGLYYPETTRTKPLHLHGYQGFAQDYEQLRKLLFPERTEPYQIIIHEGDHSNDSFDGLKITHTEITHNPHLFHAASYRIEAEENGVIKSLAYSGDCGYDERLIKISENADIGIFEMSNSPEKFTKNGPTPNHISPYECGQIAAKAELKNLVLVHWYDDSPQEAVIAEVQKNFKGKILIPEDLDTIEF